MENIIVKTSQRKKKRDLKNSLGNDIVSYIAELVTNSDDSYKRLEKTNSGDVKKITIVYGKGFRNSDSRGMISIIDNAEGMSKEKLKQKFGEYGSDHNDGDINKARGIFGQGASDVLRCAAESKNTAKIISFKDGKCCEMYYNINEQLDYSISIDELNLRKNDMTNIRQKYGIPGNGTVVMFGIPEHIQFKKSTIKKLAQNIEIFPSLRYILNQKNRQVILKIDNDEQILSSAKYSFDKKEKVFDQEFNYEYESDIIKCKISLYKNPIKLEDKTKIIVKDENDVVYDNTMFDFENNVSAQNISGELIINGFYALCDKKLKDPKNPVALIQDNRTGLDTKKPFYLGLSSTLYPIILGALEKFGVKNKTVSLANNRKINDALKKLNRYINSELKETAGGNIHGINPPPNGIKFARPTIVVTNGKTYDLKIYINPDLITTNDQINLTMEQNTAIAISPTTINYSSNDIKDGVAIKNVTITTLDVTNKPVKIEAKCNNFSSTVLITVINEEVHYPENGMEFYPSNIRLVFNTLHHAKLFFDTSICKIGDKIIISSEKLEIKNEKEIIISEQMVIPNTNIGFIDVVSNGGDAGNDYNILATCNNLTANVKITLTETSDNSPVGGGLIAGVVLEDNNRPFIQAYYDTHTHVIHINKKNNINLSILGNLADKKDDNPKFDKEESKYVSEIIATQASYILVKTQNARKGEIGSNDPTEFIDEIMNDVQNHKNKIFDIFYSALTSKTN